MKKLSGIRALLSTAGMYAYRHTQNYEQTLERIGERIGSKLTVLHNLERKNIGPSSDSWGRAVTQKILPLFGLQATYGTSRSTGRLIIKIPVMWSTADDTLSLPAIPTMIERIFEGWGVPLSTEIHRDKSILLALFRPAPPQTATL
ncbi:hypothetical protein NEDG_00823 [Nematocida displodere]|uniref:Uncharacterized protein n=1 Tax=Nematocida displodere TaxID=1805483 RepID=A0A177EE53_9MICR|nr:hypothetical protein NEDG_00823 [Nematocida displodere]